MSDLSSNLNSVLKSAPELGQSPGLAVGVAAAGGDTQTNAQSVARGAAAVSDQNAQTRVASAAGSGGELTNALNWFGNHVAKDVSAVGSDLTTGAEKAGSDVLNTMNKPLQMVQHEYRYLHDVEARHGMLAATLEGIGVAAGAAAGFVGGGLEGAVLGGETAAGLEGQFFYNDSWDRTTDGNTYHDPNTGQTVSLGRDITSLLGLRSGSTGYKITSGLIDGIADIGLDPLAVGGRLSGAARSAEGAPGLLAARFGGTAPRTLGEAIGGAGSVTGEDVDRIYQQYPSVRRAFDDIAGKSAGEIAATPAYQSIARESGVLKSLGQAQTGDDVAQVFKDVYRTHELAFTDKLPTLSWTRANITQPFREMAENSPGQLGTLAQRLTRLPDSFDSATKAFTGKDFDPSDPLDDGSVGLYRMLRYTENRKTAASIVDTYANAPDLTTKLRIFRNEQLNMLFSMAGLRGVGREQYLQAFSTDPDIRNAMSKALDDAVSGGMFSKEAVYGLDDEGHNLSMVRDAQGNWQYGAGITSNQTGRLAFLDLNQARRAAKTIAGATDAMGRIGDFAYDNITQGLFKPLVLLTPSYALHISLAELIPNMMRAGVGNIVKSGVLTNMAKLGVRAGDLPGELTDTRFFDADLSKIPKIGGLPGVRYPQAVLDAADKTSQAVQGLAWKLVMAGRKQLPDKMDAALEKRLQLAARYIEANGGHVVVNGLSSGHAYSDEVANREEKSVSLIRRAYADSPKKTSKTFGIFGQGHEQYVTAWQSWLREIAKDEPSQIAARRLISDAHSGVDLETASGNAARDVADHIRAMPEEERSRMMRSNNQITSYAGDRPVDMDSIDDWARVKVANLRGATRGADKTMNASLLGKVASGEWATESELNDIPEVSRPINVKGREIVPDGSSTVQRIANVGFRRVLNPMVNFLSRQPIAFQEFERQWALQEPKIAMGLKDEDEAMVDALNHTVNNVIKNVHNLHDRTQWTVTMRNWAPFFFAQEQAYRRMGRLLAEDPGAFRRYQMMISNIGDVGQIFGGKNGQSYFVMPGTGFLTGGVAAAAQAIGLPISGSAPVGMGWNLNSTSVIFPLSAGIRPDIGPLAAIPIQAISQLFPETVSPVLKSDFTAATDAVLGPNATEPIYSQMVPNVVVQRLLSAAFPAFNSRAFNSTMMQVLQTLDYEHKLPAPGSQPWVMQSFLDRVRNQTRVMYAMKALVGAVTPVSPELQVQSFGFPAALTADINKEKSVSKGIQVFLEKNPDATAYTVYQSTNPQGTSVPASVAAENWINDNLPKIRQYGAAALLLMPPNTDTTYNSSVYNEQIAQGLRTKWFPGDVLPNGDLEGYLTQLYVSAGNAIVLDKWYPQYEKQLQGLTGSEKYSAEQAWQSTLTKYATQNPIWGTWWNSDQRETQRGQTIKQMKQMFASGNTPDSPIAKQTEQLLNAYSNYQNQITVGTQDGFVGETESQINQQWKDNLYATVAAHPEVANVVNGLFLSLPSAQPQSATTNSNQPGSFNAQGWQAA